MNTCISCCGPCGSLTPARLFVQAFFVTQKYHHTHLYYDLLILDTWTAKICVNDSNSTKISYVQ